MVLFKAHSCVEKAGMIAMVKIRLLETDENFSLRGSTVEKAIKEDKSNGLIPFFVKSILNSIKTVTLKILNLGFLYIWYNIMLFF